MKIYKILRVLVILLSVGNMATAFTGKQNTQNISRQKPDSLLVVPLGGNTWRTDKDTLGGAINNAGITHWSNKNAVFTTYVRLARTGKLKVWLNLKVNNGESRIALSILNISRVINGKGSMFKDYDAGEWNVTDTGYVAIRIKGLHKTGEYFADINSIKIAGTAVDMHTAFVKNNDGEFFYWGRRGPSVHLSYTAPEKTNIEWFYNEVTVPKGNDVMHAYFMAAGFGEGYFGMQVNSPTERHVLFSVWSPYKTDNPGQIPDDQKIVMLKKGANVHTGEFGNEGSGGQSYLQYNWIAGNTYKLLIRGKPDEHNHTVYTAWFYAPELNKWQLIASFSRPQTSTWLKHLHSFLENFEPEDGIKTRKVFFNNQWIADENGNWMELSKARFTIDNTGAKGYRMDYAGGIDQGSFYLKNCGFFNNYTPKNTLLERPLNHKKPDIDFEKLP